MGQLGMNNAKNMLSSLELKVRKFYGQSPSNKEIFIRNLEGEGVGGGGGW